MAECTRDSRIGCIIILLYLIFICKRAQLFLASWEKFQLFLTVSLIFLQDYVRCICGEEMEQKDCILKIYII